jgi:hypothetical protein
MFITNF